MYFQARSRTRFAVRATCAPAAVVLVRPNPPILSLRMGEALILYPSVLGVHRLRTVRRRPRPDVTATSKLPRRQGQAFADRSRFTVHDKYQALHPCKLSRTHFFHLHERHGQTLLVSSVHLRSRLLCMYIVYWFLECDVSLGLCLWCVRLRAMHASLARNHTAGVGLVLTMAALVTRLLSADLSR